MKLYLVSGVHPHIPGRRQSLHASEAGAHAAAHTLISAIASDLSYDDAIPAANDWEAHLAAVKADNAEHDFDVWIDSMDVADIPPGPVVLEELLRAGDQAVERLAECADLHSPEEDDAIALRDALQMMRFAAIWQAGPIVVPPLSEETLASIAAMKEAHPLIAVPAEPPRVVVEIRGGLVEDVYADRPMLFRCIDRDLDGIDEVIDVPRPDGSTVAAYRGEQHDVTVDPALVEAVDTAEVRDIGDDD